jgi:hypothetical protein
MLRRLLLEFLLLAWFGICSAHVGSVPGKKLNLKLSFGAFRRDQALGQMHLAEQSLHHPLFDFNFIANLSLKPIESGVRDSTAVVLVICWANNCARTNLDCEDTLSSMIHTMLCNALVHCKNETSLQVDRLRQFTNGGT